MEPLDLPGAYLVLDLGNTCPLSCRHCIQSEPERHGHFRVVGRMEADLALGLLDELQERGRRFHALILFWLGEPLQHPEFGRIYRRAAAAARAGVFRRIEVHTNAVLLTPEVSAEVLACRGVAQRWHFSLDAACRRTYARIKGADRFIEVEEQIGHLLRERQARGADDLQVVFQFIPQRDNEGEATRFVSRWRARLARLDRALQVHGRSIPEEAGDCVFFRQLDALDPADQATADARYDRVLTRMGLEAGRGLGARLRARLSRADEGPGPVPCACPFLSPVVHWDGRVTVCTRDSDLRLEVGSLEHASFHDIWWESDALRGLRDAHLSGDAGGLCADCPIPHSANYTGLAGQELDRYRRRRSR